METRARAGSCAVMTKRVDLVELKGRGVVVVVLVVVDSVVSDDSNGDGEVGSACVTEVPLLLVEEEVDTLTKAPSVDDACATSLPEPRI